MANQQKRQYFIGGRVDTFFQSTRLGGLYITQENSFDEPFSFIVTLGPKLETLCLFTAIKVPCRDGLVSLNSFP